MIFKSFFATASLFVSLFSFLFFGHQAQVQAAGIQLSEQSVVGLGRSFAGMAVSGDDISAVAYNPAGLALTNYKAFQAGGIIIKLKSTIDGQYSITSPFGSSTTKGSADVSELKFIPSIFGTYDLSDKWTFSLGMYGGYGFDLNYDENWFGRNHALQSTLTAIDIHPAIGFKVNDYLSFGAGFILELIEADLTQAYPFGGGHIKLGADDTNFGVNVGVMFTPFEGTRLGLSYRSRIEHRIKGKAELPNMTYDNAFADFDTPDFALFSVYQKVNDKLSLTGTVRWTNWSVFQHLRIQQNGGQTLSTVEESWNDSWYFSLGADYIINDKFTVRGGVAYDTTVIKDAKFRTARIPDNIRHIVSLGLSYRYNPQFTIDLAYMHVFVNDSIIDNDGGNRLYRDNLSGHYKSSMDLFGLQLQYKF